MVTHVMFRFFNKYLCYLSLDIERLAQDSSYKYLTKTNLIYPRQSGFRKNHSTDTALIQIVDGLLFTLDKNIVSVEVLVDYFKKAFDMVDNGLLLNKLKIHVLQAEVLHTFY